MSKTSTMEHIYGSKKNTHTKKIPAALFCTLAALLAAILQKKGEKEKNSALLFSEKSARCAAYTHV